MNRIKMSLSFIAMPLFGIWFLGALLLSLYGEIERKHDCIEQKGFIKGLLYCEGDFENPFNKMIKNLDWPFKLLSSYASSAELSEENSLPREVMRAFPDTPKECFLGYKIRKESCYRYQRFHFDIVKNNADSGDVQSQLKLAEFYAYGYGTDINFTKAFETTGLAAATGKPEALFSLGWHYENGIGTPRNFNLAFNSYLKSANAGYYKAQYNLGLLYLDGKGVSRNFEKAKEWFTLSAKQGNALALNNIGAMYSKGWGVGKNNTIALAYIYLAASLGNEDAIMSIPKLEKMLSTIEINKAKQFSKTLMN